MAEIYHGDLEFDMDWGGFDQLGVTYQASGEAVQKFIKSQFNKKIGYLHTLVNQKINDIEYHILLGFANEESYILWEASGSDINSDLILAKTNIPVAEPEAGYIIKFQTKSDKEIITTGNQVLIYCKFNTFLYDPSVGTDFVSESGKVTISKRLTSGSDFIPVTAYTIDGVNKNYIDGISPDIDQWNVIDITDILSIGNQEIRITIEGQDSGLTTSYNYKVNNINLGLEFITSWETAQDITEIFNPTMLLEYKIKGSVNKTLNLNISTGETDIDGNPIYKTYKRSIGYNPVDRYVVNGLSDGEILSHGIHTIEAWLSVDGKNIESDHIISQVMIVSDKNNIDPYIIINDCPSELTNWTNQTFFTYALYHPSKIEIPLDINITNLDNTVNYLHYSALTPVKQKLSFVNNLSINNTNELFAINATIKTNDVILWNNRFTVSNRGNYAPISGSTFVFDVKNRYNSEENPETIFNAINNEKINASWSNMSFNDESGWIADSNKTKCLRILSGQQLNIDYNPYSKWTNQFSGAFEFDIATRNVIDPSIPILRICNYDIPNHLTFPNGFELKGMSAVVGMPGKVDYLEQDIAFREGVRTHIMVVYYNNADSYVLNGEENHINYIKLYINGCLSRIIEYSANVWDNITPRNIMIGNDLPSADIDIYNIRFYQDMKFNSDDVFQNYISSIETVDEKERLLEDNDIYENGVISYNKVYGKYNTLVWKPNDSSVEVDGVYQTRLATIGDADVKFNGDLVINIIGDKKRSGTITYLTTKGQGTSSMNYFKWNQRWEFNKIDGHKSTFISDLQTGSDENGNPIYEKHEGCYQLVENTPFAKRLDGKINWASPMQSHKIGSTALYNDLWKKVITEGNSITSRKDGQDFTKTENGYADCRVAIKQLPFFMFVQNKSTDSTPEFYGLYTMGPSKGDKPTFGYNEDDFPGFVMMEGCDNETPLVMYRVPWNDVDVRLNDDGEIYEYLESYNEVDNQKINVWTEQWEISMGEMTSEVYEKFKELNNFIYLHNTHLNPFIGSFDDLQLENKEKLYLDEFYWVTEGENIPSNNELQAGINYKYNVYRYDSYIDSWVNAGIEHTGETRVSDYEPFNIKVQTGIDPSIYSSSEANQKFIQARIDSFKTKIGKYINVDDVSYSIQFLKLIAASDNWAKNTYLYTTGIKEDGELEPFRFFQDDLDTIFATNNVGYKSKAYYIEEHDGEEVVKNPNGDLAQAATPGQSYWISSKNALYTLVEQAFDMPGMMYRILQAAVDLSDSLANSSLQKLEDCFNKYYMNISQHSFPIKSYNEIAKLYEDAHKAMFDGRGYNPPAKPLAQVTGNAVEGEKQWIKQRLAYISSYSQFGMFGAADGTGTDAGILAFRTPTPMSDKKFTLNVTPSMWLYPSMAVVQASSRANRTPAGKSVQLSMIAKQNQTTIIRGTDYLYSMGDLSNLYTDTAGLSITGAKLKDFTIANETGFQPSSLSFSNIPNMEKIDLSGKGLNIGGVTISKAPRLKYVNLSGTSISNITLPSYSNIETLILPGTLRELNMNGLQKLHNFEIKSYRNLSSISVQNMPNFDIYQIVDGCKNYNVSLNTLVIDNIKWQNVKMDLINYLLGINTCKISGTIAMDPNESLDFNSKMKLIDKFGNIDDPANDLYISYTYHYLANQNKVSIKGYNSVFTNGIYQYSLKYLADNNIDANDFVSIKWSISNNLFGSIDENTGIFNYVDNPDITNIEDRRINISCQITRMTSGGGMNTFEVTKTIFLYQLPAKVGDYVYADGTYSNPDDNMNDKTIVAVCFYAENGVDVSNQKRLAVGIEAASIGNNPTCWGLNEDYIPNKTFKADIPDLINITSTGSKGDSSSNNYSFYLGSNIAIDSIQNFPSESFTEKYKNTAIGDIGWSNNMAKGKNNTLSIINYRDEIIDNASINNPNNWESENMSSEYEYLCSIINNQSNQSMRSRYYPAVSYCYSYEPGVKPGGLTLKAGEKLSDKLKVHNWFLPSVGELVHIWYYLTRRTNIEGVNLSSFNIFQGNIGGIKKSRCYLWSSSEYNSNMAYAIEVDTINIGDDYIAGNTSLSGTNAGKKYDETEVFVLPIVEF